MEDISKKEKRHRFFEHQDLLLRFTIRQIERQTKGSWLGMFWVIVNPLLMLALFTFVFGVIMGGDFGVAENPGRFDYPLGIFIGLTIMGLATETMGQGPQVILSHQNLVKKVVFPLYLLPMATVGSIFFKTLVSCLLAFLALLLVGPGFNWGFLWFPLILFPMLLLALGLAWLFSALGVYFHDSQQLTGFFGTALFYASAVFYPSSAIPAPIYDYLKYNPILQAIELSRDVLLWDIPLAGDKLLFLYLSGSFVCLAGYLCFRAMQEGFADVL